MKRLVALFILTLVFVTGSALAEHLAYQFTGLDHGIHYHMRWHSSPTLEMYLQYRGGTRSLTVTADENGIFEGDISLPEAYAGNNVYITVSVPKRQTLVRQFKVQTILPMTEPVDRNPDGPLNGLIVCIDPGHQDPATRKTSA